jgi:serine/threonine protein kinase
MSNPSLFDEELLCQNSCGQAWQASDMARTIEKNQKFGQWELKRQLGNGGNGVVWLAHDRSSNEAAIKFLTNFSGRSKAKVYARFRNEVNVVRANSDIDGILPLMDFHLPEEVTEDDIPWYAMPVAQTAEKYLEGKDFAVIIRAIVEIGETLAELHDREICHRDIKPANVLVRNERFYLADFGLVDYPDKADLTSTGEQLGAKWTIAPEMKRDSTRADGKLADVYSLAKTLWILLTGKRLGFEGQYDPGGINGLGRLNLIDTSARFMPEELRVVYTKPLDDLLKASTNDDPLQRPSMQQFVEQLTLWVDIYKDYRKQNPLQWQEVQSTLFPVMRPQRAIWEDIDSIVEVLNHLGSISNLNHMHVPDGGGVDVRGARLGQEFGTIELVLGEKKVYVVKPKRLVFENFDFDWEWNYFRLETDELEPTGLGHVIGHREELREVAPLRYVSETELEIDQWREEEDRRYLPDPRLVCRYMHGDFLILQKTSAYNSESPYTGMHDQMGTDDFREYIAQKVQLVQSLLNDEEFKKTAIENGWAVNDLIREVLREVFHKDYMERFRKNRLLSNG